MMRKNFAWWLLFRDPPSDPAVEAAYGRIQATATAAIASLMRASAGSALLGRPDAERELEVFAQFLRSGQNGLAAWWYENPDATREFLVDRVVEICWTGLERLSDRNGPANGGSS